MSSDRNGQWEWLASTRALQEEYFLDVDFASMTPEDRATYISTNVLAANLELAELLGEVGWKPWTSPRGWINRDEAVVEVVDVLHFIANILAAMDVSEVELWEAYRHKQSVNRQRQTAGYDGRSGKCPNCGRATDDKTTDAPCACARQPR